MKKKQNSGLFENIKVTYDPELDKYDNVILCPESYERAKKIIDKYGGPEELIKILEADSNGKAENRISKK